MNSNLFKIYFFHHKLFENIQWIFENYFVIHINILTEAL